MKNLLKMRGAKRNMLALLMLLLVGVAANAVPAKPGQKRLLTLDNGTTVTATLVGDEYGHYWQGDDGRTYSDNGDTYRRVDAQMVKKNAQLRRESANHHRMQRMKRMTPIARGIGQTGNYSGPKKGLIILVNFGENSTHFQSGNNQELFNKIANQENFNEGDFKGSMYDYFLAQSRGDFQLTFDVVGPVEVEHKASYYGQNKKKGGDKFAASMVIEALGLVDDQVDFSKYDWDGDLKVDQVYVVYAGKGEHDGGGPSTIWPHEWTLTDAQAYGDGSGPQVLDDVTIDTYACGSELNGSGNICGIGTMCHEFSHCLGYPDYYDTDYSGGQGMFMWDLMDTGSYNGDGYLPAGYTSYERWAAGWLTPIELSATTTSISNMQSLQEGGEAYVIYNKGNRNEFFMLENRQQKGWDGGIPGEGLLILHVDYDADVWADNGPNNDPSHQRMTWIPADNDYQYKIVGSGKEYTTEGASTDPFPYGAIDAFGGSTMPAAKFFNKNSDKTYYLDSSVEQITQNDNGMVSFLFRAKSNVKAPTFSQSEGLVTISCETQGATIYYTLDGSTPTTESTIYSEPFTLDEPTIVKAMAVKDGEQSALALQKITISHSDPNTTTFKRVASVNDMLPGMRYIIACESKNTAAGELANYVLGSVGVSISNDVVTIDDNVAVFMLTQTTDGWVFKNEDNDQYLYATNTKKLAYGSDEEAWSLSDGDDGVVMTYGDYGTMLYNASSPRFTTYTSKPNASMIQANLYMECSGTTPLTPDPVIVTDEMLEFETTVGTAQTLQLEVLSEGLTEDITLTLSDENGVFSLSATTIDKAEEDAIIDVTFAPQSEGDYFALLTLSSKGAEDVYVVLSGTATEGSQPVVGDNVYELVTDASTLADGDEVIIAYVADENVLAMSTTQANNNRPATTDVTLNADGTLTPGDEVQLITLEKDGSNFLFNVDGGYLYAASSSGNQLKTETTADDNAKATISISDGNATIIFQGSNTRNHLRYNENANNGSPLFSCYASTSSVITLPQIYRRTKQEVVNVTIGEAGYATLYYNDVNLVVPEGVEAYTYSLADGGGLQPSVLAEGDIINKGTAVVLKSLNNVDEPQGFNFLITSDEGTTVADNLLMGSYTETITYGADDLEEYVFYMLSLNARNDTGSVGFYYGAEDGGAFTSQPHKAWLAVPRQQASGIKAFLFNGDIVSAVEHYDVERSNANAQHTTVYDLLGRKMPKGQLPRGLYIVNGRKVVVK